MLMANKPSTIKTMSEKSGLLNKEEMSLFKEPPEIGFIKQKVFAQYSAIGK